jgi:hypothetical protein
MALSRAEFLVRFQEFEGTDVDLVQSKLDEAIRAIPEDVWLEVDPTGARWNDRVAWEAAHLLALTAFGRQASLINEDGSTSYGKHGTYLDIKIGPAVAPRVT